MAIESLPSENKNPEQRRLFFKIENMGVLPNLPKGYGYTGGAARYILELHCGFSSKPPRDIDLVFFLDEGNRDLDFEEMVNPKDTQDGHYAQLLRQDYLKTRDFTFNEVLVVEDKMFVSPQALADMQDGSIRLSEFEKEKIADSYYFNNQINKMLFKSIYMQAKMEAETGKEGWQAVDVKLLKEQCGGDFNPFWIAVFLDRIYEVDPVNAVYRFIETLKSEGLIPQDINYINDLIGFLNQELDGFNFRSIPGKVLEGSFYPAETVEMEEYY